MRASLTDWHRSREVTGNVRRTTEGAHSSVMGSVDAIDVPSVPRLEHDFKNGLVFRESSFLPKMDAMSLGPHSLPSHGVSSVTENASVGKVDILGMGAPLPPTSDGPIQKLHAVTEQPKKRTVNVDLNKQDGGFHEVLPLKKPKPQKSTSSPFQKSKEGSKKKAVKEVSPTAAVAAALFVPTPLTEPLQLGDDIINLPSNILFIRDPTKIFSLDTWSSAFTDKEREYLSTFLPQGEGIDIQETLGDLFQSADIFFGNPVHEFWTRLRRGRYHPQLTALVDSFYQLVRRKHYQEVREYQDGMVTKLESIKEMWETMGRGAPLQRKLRAWNDVVEAGGPGCLQTSLGGSDGRLVAPGPVRGMKAAVEHLHAKSDGLESKRPDSQDASRKAPQRQDNLGFSLCGVLEVVAEVVYDMSCGTAEGFKEGAEGEKWWPTNKVFQEVSRKHSRSPAFHSRRFRPQELVTTALRVLASKAPPGTKLWKPFVRPRKQGTQWTWCGVSPAIAKGDGAESPDWEWSVSDKALLKLEARFREFLVEFETGEDLVLRSPKGQGHSGCEVEVELVKDEEDEHYIGKSQPPESWRGKVAVAQNSSKPQRSPVAREEDEEEDVEEEEVEEDLPLGRQGHNSDGPRSKLHSGREAEEENRPLRRKVSAGEDMMGSENAGVSPRSTNPVRHEGIRPFTDEMLALFRKEETARYERPSVPFLYTAVDGGKTMVCPAVRTGGRNVSKGRDHAILLAERPPGVTILSLVRDAAARLPNAQGTRADVGAILQCSQYLATVPSELQLSQVVSGAMDRLHYEKDPCIKFDSERKVWMYLHRQRGRRDFRSDGTVSRRQQPGGNKRKGSEAELPEDVKGNGYDPVNDVEDKGDGGSPPTSQGRGEEQVVEEDEDGGDERFRPMLSQASIDEEVPIGGFVKKVAQGQTKAQLAASRGEGRAQGGAGRRGTPDTAPSRKKQKGHEERGGGVEGPAGRAPAPKFSSKKEKGRSPSATAPDSDQVKLLQGQLSALQHQLLSVQGQLKEVQGQVQEVRGGGRESASPSASPSEFSESSQLLRGLPSSQGAQGSSQGSLGSLGGRQGGLNHFLVQGEGQMEVGRGVNFPLEQPALRSAPGLPHSLSLNTWNSGDNRAQPMIADQRSVSPLGRPLVRLGLSQPPEVVNGAVGGGAVAPSWRGDETGQQGRAARGGVLPFGRPAVDLNERHRAMLMGRDLNQRPLQEGTDEGRGRKGVELDMNEGPAICPQGEDVVGRGFEAPSKGQVVPPPGLPPHFNSLSPALQPVHQWEGSGRGIEHPARELNLLLEEHPSGVGSTHNAQPFFGSTTPPACAEQPGSIPVLFPERPREPEEPIQTRNWL